MGEIVLSSEEWMDSSEQEIEMELKKEISNSVIRWQDFLPRMHMRILLVEADDSTRHIISALLRKCGYKVTAVADGSKAWEMLKGKAQSIDLILTEVELPSISGFSLLDMIMENESCKNLPVIMMSTHDSIGVVFNCMLKGAADFFIKPVRKNELRNLWQHVWRRHNTATSGNSGQQKIMVSSEINIASNHTNGSFASEQDNKESSDAQSSSTKRDIEAESVSFQKSKSPSQVEKNNDNLDVGLPMHESEGTAIEEEHASANQYSPLDVVEEVRMVEDDISHENMQNVYEQVRPQIEVIDLIGSFDDRRQTHAVVREVLSIHSKPYHDTNETSNKLELSLRRFNPSECEYQQTEERRSLNHSNSSAFSRYNNRTEQPFQSTLVAFHAKQTECADNSHKNMLNHDLLNTIDTPKQSQPIPSNHQESTKPQIVGRPTQQETSFDSLCSSYGTLLPPMLYTHSCPPSLWSAKAVDHQNTFFENSHCQAKTESNQFHQVHDKNGESGSGQMMNKRQKLNVEYVENQVHVTTDTDQSRSSSLCNGGASNFNSSGYARNCNGSNGNVIPAAAAKATAESGHNGIKGMDTLHTTQRELALNKFRLKRKDRCFDKKVRYQSRKKLAEQRPRVKGQFVRQVSINLPLTETNC
ncbi:hypothetical protein C5167_032680 [Papaver somniferum]|uniref:Two-component response regulator-like APRR5 n=1 Tax=Papaver somniferum TaxID=3469 RepID=A0A4Y7KCB4_PAPSO|nr:two-component response regulator-like APRR9 [Papaver somniferum]RZC69585.1 hypothetical protein C5167_032680 [Papaver somniferum]